MLCCWVRPEQLRIYAAANYSSAVLEGTNCQDYYLGWQPGLEVHLLACYDTTSTSSLHCFRIDLHVNYDVAIKSVLSFLPTGLEYRLWFEPQQQTVGTLAQ